MKQKPRHVPQINKNHTLAIVAAVILGGLAGLSLLMTVMPKHTGRAAGVGQTLATPAIAVTVTSAKIVTAREFMTGQPVDGAEGLVVAMRVTNKTKQTQPFLPVNHVYVRDNFGHAYGPAPLSDVKNPLPGGILKPGQTAQGEISFIADKTAGPRWIYVDTHWDNSVPLVTRL
jgi:hypothetical protein